MDRTHLFLLFKEIKNIVVIGVEFRVDTGRDGTANKTNHSKSGSKLNEHFNTQKLNFAIN